MSAADGGDAIRGDIISHEVSGVRPLGVKPTWLIERLEWFQDLKLGLILHWGPYCQWDCCESWPLAPEDTWARPDGMECWVERGRDLARFQQDYWALNTTFDPRRFDPEGWADAAADAGMKYVVFTTKHHDGFCMWDTRTTDYRITHPSCPFSTHPQADIVRAVFEAFRSRGLQIGCYFSKSDWHSPHYWWPGAPVVGRNPNYDTHARPDIWQGFVDLVHAQIRELLTDYGPIDILWLDGGQVRPPDQDIDMPRLAAMARELQPGLIIADRTVGGDYEDFVTPEQMIPDEPPRDPWESCLTIGNGWKHSPGKMTYKAAATVIQELLETISKGGNILLGVGPTEEGVLNDVALSRLAKLGDFMRVNGEAIYGARPIAPYRDGPAFLTTRDDIVYATAPVAQLEDGELPLRAIRPAEGTEVELLGHGPVPHRVEADRVTVPLPEGVLPCADFVCIKYWPGQA